MNSNTNTNTTAYCSSCEAAYTAFSNNEIERFYPCFSCSNKTTAEAAVLESGNSVVSSSSHTNLMSQNPITNNEMNSNNQNEIVASASAANEQFPALTEYQSKRSLVAAIEGIFERIEILSADERINEGEYLQFAELVKDMYNFRSIVRTNTVYVEIARQSQRREPTAPRSMREKLEDPRHCVACVRCDNLVGKAYYASGEHFRTATCITKFQGKLNVRAHKAVHMGRYATLQVLNLELVAKADVVHYGEGRMVGRVLGFSPIERRQNRIADLCSSEDNYHKIDGKWTVMPLDYVPPIPLVVAAAAPIEETEEEKTERLRLRRNQLSRESKARARDRRRTLAQGTNAADADDAVLEEIFGVAEVADEAFGLNELFDDEASVASSSNIDDAERKRLRRNQLSRESKARARARVLANATAGGGSAAAVEEEEVETCGVCMLAYTQNRRIKLTAPCSHHHCLPCWKHWSQNSLETTGVVSCPECRENLTAWSHQNL